jgi:hypothetical protein
MSYVGILRDMKEYFRGPPTEKELENTVLEYKIK